MLAIRYYYVWYYKIPTATMRNTDCVGSMAKRIKDTATLDTTVKRV